LIIGLKKEDDSFDATENLSFKMRRNSITMLSKNNHINNHDE
jgi:hypothetical protein